MTSNGHGQRILYGWRQFRKDNVRGITWGIALVGVSVPVPAAVFTVTSRSDPPAGDASPGNGVCETATGNGLCTLRAAIQETNALAGDDTIILPPTIYLLTQVSKLEITGNLTIRGGGASTTIIDGNKFFRLNSGVLTINSLPIVNISGVTVRNGANGAESGGGISNSGTLTLANSVVSGNSADNAFENGGGIYNFASAAANLFNTTITNNHYKMRYHGNSITLAEESRRTLLLALHTSARVFNDA